MDKPISVKVGVGIWLFTHLVRPDLLIKYRRRAVLHVRERNRPIAGRGVLRIHACPEIFDFYALCQQPIESQGGPAWQADCRACIRLLKKAGRGSR